MIRTAICDLLGIRYPIIQGGMAWLGSPELVSAVSNAGGLGVIGSGAAPPDELRRQIARTRQLTDKPFAVNLVLVSPYFKENADIVIEEKVSIVATGAGNPGPFVSRFKQAGMKVVPVVASVALARRLERQGADVIVAEGTESGGHVGETTTIALVPQVVDAVKVPVVAAGGLADGRGLAAALSLGAAGIQMGTRFVCSDECIAHTDFKKKIIAAGDRDTVVTGASIGHPVRCLENKATRQYAAMEKAGATGEELEQYFAGRFRKGVVEGDVEGGSLMAGQIAGLIKDVKPVKQIIEDIMREAETAIRGLEKVIGG